MMKPDNRGKVYKTKTGSWGYIVDDTPDPTSGRRRQKRKQGFEFKWQATDALNIERLRLKAGGSISTAATTVEDLVEQWLKVRKASVRPSTYASYENHLRSHISKQIGALTLDQLTPAVVAELFEKLAKDGGRKQQGLSPRTLVHVHKLLGRMFNDAVSWGVLSVNPVDQVPRPKAERYEASTWTPEQLRAFLAYLDDTEHRLRAAWYLAASTGMRRGELLGLRWSDVDLDASRLSIRQTLTALDHEIVFGPAKTERSERAVPLSDAAVDQLRAHKSRQNEDRLAWPGDWPNDLVFMDQTGSPIHPRVFSRTHKRLCVAAELEPIRVHDLRHSWATMALQQGVPMKVVSEALGHSSITVTADLYSHVTEDMARDAVDAVAQLLSPAQSPGRA